jgi:anti-anti-sigma regulatory factor
VTSLRLGRLDVQIDPATRRVVMTGRIDDSSALSEVLLPLPKGPVVIDTSGVTFINSIGMREWIRLVRAIRDRGDTITLERVADVLITQMNLIPEFAGAVTIVSFHAQYVCPGCGAESAPVVDAVAHATELGAMRAPRLPCSECGAAMELGDFPERYLMLFRV